MSLAVVINLEFYALVISDRRRVAIKHDRPDEILHHIDDCTKIHDIRLGLMTGLGYAPLLSAVEHQIASTRITATDQVENIFNEQRRRFMALPIPGEHKRECIESKTYVLFSFVTPQSASEGPRIRAAGIHPEWEASVLIQSFVGVPYGASKAQYDQANTFLHEKMKPMQDWSEFDENLAHNMAIGAGIVREFAAINPYVSPDFQVGLHSLRHGILISDVVKPGEPVRFPLPASQEPARRPNSGSHPQSCGPGVVAELATL